MQLYVIIVAGGSGTRMKSEMPKQFIELAGKPILMHTIEQFKAFDNSIEIITVLPGNQLQNWNYLQEKYSFTVPQTVVKGGRTRYHSVKNGLDFVSDTGLVAIHDGVRPLVSLETIVRCFETAEKLGNAVPVVEITESLRMIIDEGNSYIDRQKIRTVQTPQVFNAAIIKKAYNQTYKEAFTDDATLVETMGEKINLVEGSRENIKITTPLDILIANALFFSSK